MHPLPAPLDGILPPLVEDLQAALGPELVGAYLYGSAVEGGFDRDLSDLDMVVVTAPTVDEIDYEVFARIVDRLAAREPEWADRLDIVFVGGGTLAGFRSGGPLIEISHQHPLRLLRRADEWIETWFLARHADRPLVGPSAGDVFPRIGIDTFLQAVVDGIDQFVASALHDEATSDLVAYRLLTVCRLLRSLETRALSTKQQGADWTIEEYPEWAWVIRAALVVRASRGRRRFSHAERAAIRELLAFLGSEVHRAAP